MITAGSIVKIRNGYENQPEELDMTYTVVEVLPDRAYITPTESNLPFPGTECVALHMIELA